MKFVPEIVNHVIVAKLDVSDLPTLADDARIKPFLRFSIRTYSKLSKTATSSNWSITFDPVNEFFASQSIEVQTEIAMAILTMHRMLIEFGGNLKNAILINELDKIGAVLAQLNTEIRLCDRIKEYALKHLPIGDHHKVGLRPQDRAEFTFHQDEIEDLIVIVVLCKMMAPLFGVLIEIFSINEDTINPGLKPTYTARLFNMLFNSQYPALIAKLEKYLSHSIATSYRQDMTVIFSGVTPISMDIRVMSNLIVKSLVNIDLLFRQGSGNVMTYIYSTARSSATTETKNATSKGSFRIRQSNEPIDGDASTVSQIEVDSVTSIAPLDVAAYIPATLDGIIDRCLVHYDLDDEVYAAMVKYYISNPFPPSKLNKAIITGFFGSWLGGGQTVLLGKYTDYCKMVALCQLIAFTNSWPCLANMLTARESQEIRELTDTEISLKINYGTCPEYTNCREKFSTAGTRRWEDGIRGLVQSLLTREWLFNTADVVWEQAGEPNRNGTIVQPSPSVGSEISMFIEQHILD